MKKALVVLLVTAVLFVGLWRLYGERFADVVKDGGLLTVFETEPPADQTAHREKYFFSALNEAQKQAYANIYENIFDFPDEIKVPKIDEDGFNLVHHALVYDNPELFFMARAAVMEFRSRDCIYRPSYACTMEEYAAMLAQAEVARREIYAAIPADADAFAKEKVIHDKLVSGCAYGVGAHDSDLYGALVSQKAVCSGYAMATKYLLDGLDIYNYLVTGTARSGDGVESHMWNVVYLGGQPYYLDVTWDDGDFESGTAGYAFFNVTEAATAGSHFPENPAASGCVYTDFNYFIHEGLYFYAWTDDAYQRFVNLLCGSVETGDVSFDVAFDTAQALETARRDLITDQRIYRALRRAAGGIDAAFATDFINYSVNEEMRVLHFDFTENFSEG